MDNKAVLKNIHFFWDKIRGVNITNDIELSYNAINFSLEFKGDAAVIVTYRCYMTLLRYLPQLDEERSSRALEQFKVYTLKVFNIFFKNKPRYAIKIIMEAISILNLRLSYYNLKLRLKKAVLAQLTDLNSYLGVYLINNTFHYKLALDAFCHSLNGRYLLSKEEEDEQQINTQLLVCFEAKLTSKPSPNQQLTEFFSCYLEINKGTVAYSLLIAEVLLSLQLYQRAILYCTKNIQLIKHEYDIDMLDQSVINIAELCCLLKKIREAALELIKDKQKALESIAKITTDFSHCYLFDEDLAKLIKHIDINSLSIYKLDFSNNYITPAGVKFILSFFTQHLKSSMVYSFAENDIKIKTNLPKLLAPCKKLLSILPPNCFSYHSKNNKNNSIKHKYLDQRHIIKDRFNLIVMNNHLIIRDTMKGTGDIIKSAKKHLADALDRHIKKYYVQAIMHCKQIFRMICPEILFSLYSKIRLEPASVLFILIESLIKIGAHTEANAYIKSFKHFDIQFKKQNRKLIDKLENENVSKIFLLSDFQKKNLSFFATKATDENESTNNNLFTDVIIKYNLP